MTHIRPLLISLLLGSILLARGTAYSAPVGANECALDNNLRADLLTTWDIARPELTKQVEKGLAAGNPNCLYLLEEYTHPLINAARDCGMREQLDELADLYALPFHHLRETR